MRGCRTYKDKWTQINEQLKIFVIREREYGIGKLCGDYCIVCKQCSTWYKRPRWSSAQRVHLTSQSSRFSAVKGLKLLITKVTHKYQVYTAFSWAQRATM